MKESRLEFAQEWHERGSQSLNQNKPFESFIYNWLALTISAKTYKSFNIRSSKNGKNTDKEDIIYWVKNNTELVMSLMQKYREDMRVLSERTGAELNEPILDIKENTQKSFIVKKHEEFSEYWIGESRYKHARKEDINKILIYILNRIRNNLFHGEKSYNVQSDRELLETVCPILNELAMKCILDLERMMR